MQTPTSSHSQKVTDLLSNGEHGPEVTKLQQMLNQMGYHLDVDGQFGPTTAAAVRHLQRSSGVHEDGIVGPQTLHALATHSVDHYQAPRGWSHDPSLFPGHHDHADASGAVGGSAAIGHTPEHLEDATAEGVHPEESGLHHDHTESAGAHDDDEPPPAEPEEALADHDAPPHEDEPSAVEDDHEGDGYGEESAPDEYAADDAVSTHDDSAEASAFDDPPPDDYAQDDV